MVKDPSQVAKICKHRESNVQRLYGPTESMAIIHVEDFESVPAAENLVWTHHPSVILVTSVTEKNMDKCQVVQP